MIILKLHQYQSLLQIIIYQVADSITSCLRCDIESFYINTQKKLKKSIVMFYFYLEDNVFGLCPVQTVLSSNDNKKSLFTP